MRFMGNKKDQLIIEVGITKPDIICLNETAVYNNEISGFALPGYTLVSEFCRPTTFNRGGGVAIYCRTSSINTKIKKLNNIPEISEHSMSKIFELTAATFSYDNQRYAILSCYRPPRTLLKDLEYFFEAVDVVLQFLEQTFGKNMNIILCGDLNICLLTESNNLQRLTNIMKHFNLSHSNLEVTRTATRQSALDAVISNVCTGKINTKIHKSLISDHLGLITNIKGNKNSIIQQYIFKRNKNKKNKQTFSQLLLRAEDKFLSSCHVGNVNLSQDLSAQIQTLNDLTYPFTLSKNMHCTKIKGSMDIQTFHLREKVIKAQNKYSTTRLIEDKNIFSELNENYKKTVMENKSKIYRNYITNASNSSKACWELINNEYKENNQNVLKNIKIGDVSDPVKVANLFNEHFTTKADLLQKNLSPKYSPTYRNATEFTLEPMSEKSIKKIVKNLKSSTSEGPDTTSNVFLKENINLLVKPLTHLVNTSFSQGTFPKNLTYSKIIPIYKNKGDVTDINAYRPIALSSAIGKLLEKCFHSQLYDFVEKQLLLAATQFGFRQQMNTTLAIIDTLNTILQFKDLGFYVFGSYLDISCAFDCCILDILILILESMGVRGLPLQWLKSFLYDRYQYVEIMGHITRDNFKHVKGAKTVKNNHNFFIKNRQVWGTFKSSFRKTKKGVPQGSILGPLLYLIYVNHILLAITQNFPNNLARTHRTLSLTIELLIRLIRAYMYCDDTSIVVATENLEGSLQFLQEVIRFISDMFGDIGLVLNHNKTNNINFSTKSLPVQKMNTVNHCRFLGIELDNKLNWKPHILLLKDKLNSAAFVIRRFSKLGNKELAILAYNSLFQSRISYAIEVWGSCSDQLFQTIFKIQKRVIRSIKGLRIRDSCRDAFKELQIMTLPSIYVYQTLLYAKSIFDSNGFALNENSHNYNTRGKKDLSVPICKTELAKKAPVNVANRFFRCLPNDLKPIEIKFLKMILKNHFKNSPFYTISDAVASLKNLKLDNYRYINNRMLTLN